MIAKSLGGMLVHASKDVLHFCWQNPLLARSARFSPPGKGERAGILHRAEGVSNTINFLAYQVEVYPTSNHHLSIGQSPV